MAAPEPQTFLFAMGFTLIRGFGTGFRAAGTGAGRR
jgi:hypothetical protein